MYWPEGRGLTTVVNVGRPGPSALEQDTGLGPEARIKAGEFCSGFHSSGGGVGGAGGWEEHDFLFSVSDQENICGCRCYSWLICRESVELFAVV